MSPLRVLVLYWHPKGTEMRLAVRQHLHLLDGPEPVSSTATRSTRRPPGSPGRGPTSASCTRRSSACAGTTTSRSTDGAFAGSRELRCPKIALPQDEYDHAGGARRMAARARRDERLLVLRAGASADALSRCSTRRATFHETLTGFIDEDAAAALAGRIVPALGPSTRHRLPGEEAALLVRQPRPAEAPDRRGRAGAGAAISA